MTRPTFQEVPPAHTDERELQANRSRQTTFERGIALSLVVGMRRDVTHLRSLTTGLRWVLNDEEAADMARWLDRLREDILRAERIADRYDGTPE
jgi:hypothetical protein